MSYKMDKVYLKKFDFGKLKELVFYDFMRYAFKSSHIFIIMLMSKDTTDRDD